MPDQNSATNPKPSIISSTPPNNSSSAGDFSHTTAASTPQAQSIPENQPQPITDPQLPQSPSFSDAVTKVNRDLKEKAVNEQAKQLGLSYINIEKTPINPDLSSILTKEQATAGLLIPFFRIGKKLRIAIQDPQNQTAIALIEELKTQDYLLNINLASDQGIISAIDRLYKAAEKTTSQIITQINEADIQTYEKEIQNLSELQGKLKSITAEEGLNLINLGAIKTNASDIHYQPEEGRVIGRFRIDGVLQTIFEMDPKIFANLANQLKYKSGLKLNIDNIPQDGRYRFIVNGRKIDVRVSSLPTEFGETFVCRLLDNKKGFLNFEEAGFIGRNLKLMEHAVKIAHGMILITGPTGSGKTTTLYSLLDKFNTPEKKVITLEDPIEYHLSGISQSQINVKRGYDFADGLRSILRQDPDVVMVGEIRDFATAETAAQASLTGHVLLSTLHTNSAIESIPRLVNIGLQSFMIAPALHMIVAQRLVRQLCPNCRQKQPITEIEKRIFDEICQAIQKITTEIACQTPNELWHPVGCDQCSHTGYLGRLGIHEILIIDEPIKRLIMDQKSSNDIILKAREQGMLTMREDGLLKVLQDKTTLEEVQRVTQIL